MEIYIEKIIAKNNMNVYVDNASTTRVSKEVMNAMLPYYSINYGNPSSIHNLGNKAYQAIETSRSKIAKALNCYPDEIYFTSGATEANNWAIIGMALSSMKKHIIISSIEHPSVLNTCKLLENYGYKITYVSVNSLGIIDIAELENSIDNDTALISVMMANNETGVIQPVDEISKIAHKYSVPFFTDAVQAIGNLSIDLQEKNYDLLSISGHKIKAPKGIGILYINRNIKIKPLIYGGGQEKGYRSGTENVASIVGISVAIQSAVNNILIKQTVKNMKMLLLDCINKIPYSYVNGIPEITLPGTINVCFDYINGEDLVRYLSNFGIYASSSSACSSNTLEPSHVLLAMNLPYDRARGSLRLSINENNNLEEIDYIARILPNAIQTLRRMNPLYQGK